jgi:hypothetical protein
MSRAIGQETAGSAKGRCTRRLVREADADISRRYIATVLDIISMEIAYANKTIERLSIKAPISGKVRLFVNANTPVRRGFTLAELS